MGRDLDWVYTSDLYNQEECDIDEIDGSHHLRAPFYVSRSNNWIRSRYNMTKQQLIELINDYIKIAYEMVNYAKDINNKINNGETYDAQLTFEYNEFSGDINFDITKELVDETLSDINGFEDEQDWEFCNISFINILQAITVYKYILYKWCGTYVQIRYE